MPPVKLALDTTTSHLMLALQNSEGQQFKTVISSGQNRYHSGAIIPELSSLMLQANVSSVKMLEILCVNTGPGSFTGIRTGLITARTLAQFIPVTVFSFNSFVLAAFRHHSEGLPIAVFLDALRGKSYYAVLFFTPSGIQYLIPPQCVSLSLGVPEISAKLFLVAPALLPFFQNDLEGSVLALEENSFTPEWMFELVTSYPEAFKVNWPDLQPLYIEQPRITLKQQS
jgi:tRNA threonylcarbamoyl adenosine modification protein YeaZ